ncbi:hypothetical protein H6G97_34835 [Nostoc flagelliforme FACHB-838]|uniref:Uncharacterized protein n=1 Tax=Nostoc flagelliforme FACHB-838 TaxID=2692904 RepID=A0ABR8DY61_9NOSO|nr:hypothetical protein [Nostoc flagelliforme FACHB-838]
MNYKHSSTLPVCGKLCTIFSGEITVSIALNINSASTVGAMKEKSFSCTSLCVGVARRRHRYFRTTIVTLQQF